MLLGRFYLRFLTAAYLFALASVFLPAQTASVVGVQPAPTLMLNQFGKGSAPLDGSWQFHLGDDPTWATPSINDSTGQNGWAQLTADAPWGTQGHASYFGYAWYRRHIDLTPADGASPDVALLIPAIDDVYELYWNGTPVGHLGSFPPNLDWQNGIPAQTYGLGPIRSGVLAIRVYKVPLFSNDDGTTGGFEGVPVLGSPEAIANLKESKDFRWLRRQQFRVGLVSLYGLTALLSLIAWLRDRRQRLLLWMAAYTTMPVMELVLNGLRLEISTIWLTFLVQTSIQLREISQWFVLLWLLQLQDQKRLSRFTRIAALVSILAGVLDGCLGFLISSMSATTFEIADAFLTFFILPFELIPAILVIYALVRRQKLDRARWVVAILATASALWYSTSNITAQGLRFTHWTLASMMEKPIFTLFGSIFPMQSILRLLLFASIVYAVVRYSIENSRRQSALEAEFQNARELQQVLVPDTLPAIPGFTLTSAYRPAQEVGGDFFQIIPLETGETLVILGDVSGKGLKAAMAVSLIVGAVRALADDYPAPAQLLTQLNRRLCGRMQGGFATCVILRLNPGRECTLSSAGHPAPFLNDRELDLAGALPLGIAPDSIYEEATFSLQTGDHCSLYTDGLLEARSASGELYSFARLETLFATRPTAEQATDAAVHFGQDDDITVLTLTRLAQL